MREITVEASTDNLEKVTAFVDAELELLDCPSKANMQIDICIDEVFGNIAHYAYGEGSGDATVKLDFDEAERLLSLTFVDSGAAFDPRDVPEPDVTAVLEDRPLGGLGLFMVKKMTDALEYERTDGRNILTIRKRI